MKKLSKSGAACSVRVCASVQLTDLDPNGTREVYLLQGPRKDQIGWTSSGFHE